MTALHAFALSFDHTVFFFVQSLQREWLHPFLAWPTHLGAIGVLLALLGVGIPLFDRHNGYKRAISIVSLVAIQHFFMLFLKAFFYRPRPFLFWESVNVVGHRPTNDSFPSGHTSDMVTAAFLLNYFYPGAGKWAYPLAFLVAITRVYRGVHYPTDLIGGAALGIAFAAFSIVFLNVVRLLPKITARK